MRVLRGGAGPGLASAAGLLVHGRGGSPEDMLGLAAALRAELGRAPEEAEASRSARVTETGASTPGTPSQAAGPSGLAWIAIRASRPDRSWYPQSFMAPLEQNQPWLEQSLAALDAAVAALLDEGLSRRRIVLIGFSQGACLSLEWAARRGGRLGGVVGLSGGLIGPPGTPRDYPTSLDGTPAFLGCSDDDPHVPEARVRESAEVLACLEARVTTRIYAGLGHTVNEDELRAAAALLREVLAVAGSPDVVPADAPTDVAAADAP